MRSTARDVPRPDRDEEVIAVLSELVERFPERGFGRLFQCIGGRGWRGITRGYGACTA